jgi:hypothetical protein
VQKDFHFNHYLSLERIVDLEKPSTLTQGRDSVDLSTINMSKPPTSRKMNNLSMNFEKTIGENFRSEICSDASCSKATLSESTKPTRIHFQLKNASSNEQRNDGKHTLKSAMNTSVPLSSCEFNITDNLDEPPECVDFIFEVGGTDTNDSSSAGNDKEISIVTFNSNSRKFSLGSRSHSIVPRQSNVSISDYHDGKISGSRVSMISRSSTYIRELPRDAELDFYESSCSSTSSDSDVGGKVPSGTKIRGSVLAPRHW